MSLNQIINSPAAADLMISVLCVSPYHLMFTVIFFASVISCEPDKEGLQTTKQ